MAEFSIRVGGEVEQMDISVLEVYINEVERYNFYVYCVERAGLKLEFSELFEFLEARAIEFHAIILEFVTREEKSI